MSAENLSRMGVARVVLLVDETGRQSIIFINRLPANSAGQGWLYQNCYLPILIFVV